MEIRRRIGLPRTTLHVMNRGARKVSIFGGEDDRYLFMHLLERFALKHEVGIVSWCLMPNHYHLETDSEGTPLSRMMHDLDGNYARAFNERHDTVGCLFQGPFKSMAIWDPEGIAYVSRYIHCNPIAIRSAPRDYRWSSCQAYLGMVEVPKWMNTEPVYSYLRREGISDDEAYWNYLRKAPPKRRRSKQPLDEVEDFYCEWIRHLEEVCIEKLTNLEPLLGKVGISTVVCWLAVRKYGVPSKALSLFYGFKNEATVRSVVTRFNVRLEESPELARILASVYVPATQVR